MQTQRQAQVQRSPDQCTCYTDHGYWPSLCPVHQSAEDKRLVRSPTERFVDTLCEVFAHHDRDPLTDEQRVRLEDAFNEAVEARVMAAGARGPQPIRLTFQHWRRER